VGYLSFSVQKNRPQGGRRPKNHPYVSSASPFSGLGYIFDLPTYSSSCATFSLRPECLVGRIGEMGLQLTKKVPLPAFSKKTREKNWVSLSYLVGGLGKVP
jgi:hypothetical protein